MGTAELLRDRDLRVTPQRMAVYEALVRRGAHATAEEVHGAARRRIRGLSLGTVYRVLDDLTSAGLVRQFDAGRAPAYFDARLDGHHHLACVRCGAVEDVRPHGVRGLRLLPRERRGYRLVGDPEIVFRGVCESCRMEEEEER